MKSLLTLTAVALTLLATSASAQEPVALDVPGFLPAAFIEATEGTGVRPVVIGLHGNYDRPEWMCAAWAEVVRDRAFVLCPRGVRASIEDDRYSLPAVGRLQREIAAARRALSERYPGRIDDGPDVYVGFSQGAHRISRMAASRPRELPRIQLVEGGNSLFRDEDRARYLRAPGRVVVVCALPGCLARATRMARVLREAGGDAQVERIPAVHHDLTTMMPAIVRTFDHLIEGDQRFGGAPET